MALDPETKQLQEDRNNQFPDLSVSPQKEIPSIFDNPTFRSRATNPILSNPIAPISIGEQPKSYARKLGPLYDPSLDNEDFLAQRQSGTARLLNLIPRVGIKVASEVAQMPGYLFGAAAYGLSALEGEADIKLMVNNAWQNKIQDIEQDVKDRFPVYTSNAVKTGNLWDNVFSTAFWANEGADGIGFLLAFLAPGLALRMLGTGEKLARLVKPGVTFYKELEATANMDKVAQGLAGTRLANGINDVTSTVINTLLESSAEAGDSYRTIMQKYNDPNRAAETAVDVLTKNFGILGISNYIDQKWLFGKVGAIKGFAEGEGKQLARGSMFKQLFGAKGEILDQVAKRTAWENIGAVGQTLAQGVVKEGFWEEGMQFVAQKKAERDSGKVNDNSFWEEIKDVADTYASSLADTDMQKSIFLGAFQGSMVPGYHQVRKIKAEEQTLNNFHTLIKNNFLDRYRTLADFAERDPETNEIVTDNEGHYKIDVAKAQEQIGKNVVHYLRNKQMISLAQEGNEEAFAKLKNERDFNYFLPFLEVEGGLDALKYHISELADKDVKIMQENGVAIDLETTKKELINKAEKFQNIYDRITNTHDLNMPINRNKEDKTLYNDFSDLVKKNKLGTEADLKFSTDRIDTLRNNLSNYKVNDTQYVNINSDETKYSPKIVDDLLKSLDKEKDNLSPTDVLDIKNTIKNIEGHLSDLDELKTQIKNLYNKQYLQKEFQSYKESKLQSIADASKSGSEVLRNKDAELVAPELQDIFKKSIDYEDTPDKQTIRHSGEIQLSYKDENGNIVTTKVNIKDIDSDGNLIVNILNKQITDKDNKISEVEIKNPTGVLNSDNTFSHEDIVYNLDKIDIVKTPQQVIQDSKATPTKKSKVVVISPEEIISTINTAEDEFFFENYEKIPTHRFILSEGVNNFIKSTGDQRQVVSNEDLGRWYIFVNKYAGQTLESGESKYILKSLYYDDLKSLKANDPLRDSMKFYIGLTSDNKPILRSYNDIQKLTGNNLLTAEIYAREDLKMIVHKKSDNSILLVDKNGELTNGSYIVYNSFPLAATTTQSSVDGKTYNRFNTKDLRQIYYVEKLKINKRPTKAQIAEAEKWAQEQLKLQVVEYGKFRNELTKKSITFNITSINPGKKLKDNIPIKGLEVTEATGITNFDILRKNIITESRKEGVGAYVDRTNRKVSGAEYGLRNGFWYVNNQNRPELIKPKTLGESNAVEDVTKLLQCFATKPAGEGFNEMLSYLNTILFMANTTSPYRLYFVDNFNKLLFGNNEITVEDLVKGENLQPLKDFLSNKYWNFDNKYKDAKEFTEIVPVIEDGKLNINYKVWENTDGGYIGFLFSNANENSTKGTISVKPLKGNALESIIDPQYINQSLNLSNINQSIPINKTWNTKTTWTKSTSQPTEGFGRTVVNENFKPSVPDNPPISNSEMGEPINNVTNLTGSTPNEGFGRNQTNPLAEPILTGKGFKPFKIKEENPLSEPIITSKVSESQTLNRDSYWDSLDNSQKQGYVESSKSLEDAKNNAYTGYKMTENDDEPPFARNATLYDNYIREDLNNAIDWFKQKFPNIPVEIVEGLIKDKSWGALTKHATVLLSSIAEIGTMYHEGFHTFSQLVLAEESRKELYNEVRIRLNNNNLTDKEAEEILAEEFREYMLYPNAYTFGKHEVQKKNLFQKIYDWIIQILGLEKAVNKDYQIEMTFDILKNNSFGVYAKELESDFERNRIAGLSAKESSLYVQDINHTFFSLLFNPEASYLDTHLFDLDYNLNSFYKAIHDIYLGRAKKYPGMYYDNLITHFDDLVNEHIRFLKMYRLDIKQSSINFKENINEDEDDEGIISQEYAYRNSLTINMSDLIEDPVRLLIAGLPNVVNNNGVITNKLSVYKTKSVVNFNKTTNLLKSALVGLGTDIENYFEKLRELSAEHPEFNYLLKRLRAGQTNYSSNIAQLRNAFVKSFALNKNTPMIMNYNPGGKKYFQSVKESETVRDIRNTWLNNARFGIHNPNSLIANNERGDFLINTTKTIQAIKSAETLPDKSRARLEMYIDILKGLGIEITKDTRKIYYYDVISNYINRLSQEIKAKGGKEFLIQDLFNRDVIKNQKEAEALIKYTMKFMADTTDQSYFNVSGGREYLITLNSNTTNVVNALNKITVDPDTGEVTIPRELLYLMPWNGTTGSLYNGYSQWITNLKSGQKLSNVLLKGLVNPNSKDNNDITKAAFGDYKSITFNALLNGIVPHLRSADRGLETGFQWLNEDGSIAQINYNIGNKEFKSTLQRYLVDELKTSFALLIDPENWGGNLTNYKDNAKTLRVFSFLYDKDLNVGDQFMPMSLEEYSKNITKNLNDNRNTIVQVDELVEKYILENIDYLDRSFDRYINHLTDMTKQSLKEDKLIIESFASTGESMGIRLPGIDTEVLSKLNIKPQLTYGTIDNNDLNKLILFANYTQFIGVNEQLKLILGDLAMYADPVAFHKRVKGSTSTKYSTPDSQSVRDDLSRLLKRVDGKQTRTSTVSIAVVNDILTSNKELSKIFTDYNKINNTDAQSNITLDEYRDLLFRNGMWTPSHEKTYQYEMQKFVLRMLELQKDKSRKFPIKFSKTMFTKPDGVFYEHTNGKVPTNPMFEGKELKISELGVLTILKPQGFGYVNNITGLNATQFLKTSTAPIFPSALEDDSTMLDLLLSMMSNQQGMLTYRSAMKGGVIIGTPEGVQELFDKKGELNSKNYLHQELNYKDFGIQLDIHDESSGEVTTSTQRSRLEFLDVFDQSKLAKDEKLQELYKEYTNLTGEVVSNKRKDLLNERLSLTINTESGSYELLEENRESFEKELSKAFEHRVLPYNIKDGLELALKSNSKVFDVTVSKFKIEEVLNSMLKNNVIRRKTSGDMLIQESPVLYENSREAIKGNPKLKFYRKEDGKVQAMEVMIAIPITDNPITGRDFVNWVEDLGGIDVLNKAIKENNTKLLGEDFFKMLDIPMNRIPGQSLSSLDVARVVKFLPHYHGNKVVLPAEITVKANSDFDVDKMTSYFKHFKIDKKTNKFVIAGNLDNIEGKENRLDEIAQEALLHPDRFEELINPLSPKYIKSLALEARNKLNKTHIERRSTQAQWYDTLSWWYNMQKGYEFWIGKACVAIAATQNVAHAFEQHHPIRMNAYVPLFFKGQETQSGEQYNAGFMYDANDRLISRNFGEFLSSFVDVANDSFIFELTDNFSFNTVSLLNRYGKDYGVGIDSIAAFMSQNIIKNYLRIRRSNKPVFLNFNQYLQSKEEGGKYQFKGKLKVNAYDQYSQTVKEMKDNLQATDTNLPFEYKDTVAFSLQNLLDETNSIKRDEILDEINKKITNYDYKYFSLKELKSNDVSLSFRNQVQILDNFLTYQILGGNLTTLNLLLRPDASSSMGSHISATEASTRLPINTILKRQLFNVEDIAQAIQGNEENPSLIKEFYNTKHSIKEIFGWTSLIHKDPVVSKFFQDNIQNVFGDANRWTRKSDLDKIFTDIESDFMVSIIARSFGNIDYKAMRDIYNYLMTGKNSIAKQLLKLKGTVVDNSAIELLEPIIEQRIGKTRTLADIDNIAMFSGQLDSQDIDAIEDDLYEFGVHTTLDNQRFVSELILESCLQSGFHNTPNSFSKIVPNRLFIDFAEKAVDSFLNQTDEAKQSQLDSFLVQMYKNNTNNPRIVKKGFFMRKTTSPILTWEDKSKTGVSYFKGYDWISRDYYMANPKSYIKNNQKPPIGTALYYRVPGTNIFQLTNKMGDGLRFREFYPNVPVEELEGLSIVESNFYGEPELDVIYDEDLSNPTDEDISYYDPDNYMDEDEINDDNNESLPKSFDTKLIDNGDLSYIEQDQKNSYIETIKKSGEKSTIQIALRLIEQNSTDKTRRELAKILRNIIKTPYRLQWESYIFEHESNRDSKGNILAVGYYDHTETFTPGELHTPKNTFINLYEKLDDLSFERVLLHESIHALSSYEYYHNNVFRDRITRMMHYSYNYLSNSRMHEEFLKGTGYVFTDPTEFIAWGLTNEIVQSKLALVPAENQDKVNQGLKKKSVLTEFMDSIIDVIKKYFNTLFSGTHDEYNKEVQNLTSVLQDLILTVQDHFIDEKSIANNVVEDLQPSNIKQKNKVELNKEYQNDFERLFPEYSYLNDIEQEAFNDAINKGDLEIACGI